MIPVLAVNDPAAARRTLAELFGFKGDGPIMTLGGQSIVLAAPGETPEKFIPLRLDHVALSVADADESCRAYLARGARLSSAFTPDGPKEIPEFWDGGVRFVFFDGPEGWPLEFCALKVAAQNSSGVGHGHYGIRRKGFEAALGELALLGAVQIARHRLGGGDAAVNVSFLQLRSAVLEVFDEPPFAPASQTGWVGLVPA
jgi:catechol 2,3-dioxygenase-like lactoylglutathione lyase family enzyme